MRPARPPCIILGMVLHRVFRHLLVDGPRSACMILPHGPSRPGRLAETLRRLIALARTGAMSEASSASFPTERPDAARRTTRPTQPEREERCPSSQTRVSSALSRTNVSDAAPYAALSPQCSRKPISNSSTTNSKAHVPESGSCYDSPAPLPPPKLHHSHGPCVDASRRQVLAIPDDSGPVQGSNRCALLSEHRALGATSEGPAQEGLITGGWAVVANIRYDPSIRATAYASMMQRRRALRATFSLHWPRPPLHTSAPDARPGGSAAQPSASPSVPGPMPPVRPAPATASAPSKPS